MLLARISLIASSLLYGAVGIWFLADPDGAARVVDIALQTPSARVDFRATYGGLNLALAGLLLAAGLRPDRHARSGLILQVATFAGYAGARIFGMAAEFAVPPLMPLLLAFEITGIVTGLLALKRLP